MLLGSPFSPKWPLFQNHKFVSSKKNRPDSQFIFTFPLVLSHKVQHIQKLQNSKDKKKTGAGILKDARTSLFFDCCRRPIVAHITGVRHERHERQGWVGHNYRRCVLLRDRGITFLPAYKGNKFSIIIYGHKNIYVHDRGS